MTTHTPGPWVVDRKQDNLSVQDADYFATVMSNGGDGYHICRVWDFDGCEPYSQSTANAKLIAAAPDLLEALSRADRLLSAGESFETWVDWQKAARAAIAKAVA